MLRARVNQLLKTFEQPYETYNRIEVSCSALIHNLHLFQKITRKSVIPVLKANAYGHGIKEVATAFKRQDIPYLAVDGYFEALRVREVSKQPVLVMGMIKPTNYARMKYLDFAFVVHNEASIRALGETGKKIKVHLEINTGMNRYGVRPEDVQYFADVIKEYPKLHLEGVMSHLADSDGNDIATVQAAVKSFDASVGAIRLTGAKPRYIHLAQSAGSVRAKSKYANTIRVGIAIYGINPFPTGHPDHDKLKDLQPALKLISTITEIHELKAGDKVSYNYTFTAPKAMRVGVLPLGYYEAVNRALSNKGVVKTGGTYTPIIGRVCMNHTMMDLDRTLAYVGDEVTVISNTPGDRNTINAIAEEHSLFSYSLLTSLSPDVRRRLVL